MVSQKNSMASILSFLFCRAVFLFAVPQLLQAQDAERFIPVPIIGVGGPHWYATDNRSFFCNIVDMAAVDMDMDNDMDLVLLSGAPGIYLDNQHVPLREVYDVNPSTHILRTFLQPGDFLYGQTIPAGNPSLSPNRRAGGSDLAWLENDGFGHFALHYVPTPIAFVSPRTLRVGNMDRGDGNNTPDLVVWDRNAVYWFENRINPGNPANVVQHTIARNTVWGQDVATGFDRSFGALGDLDGNGSLDVIVGAEPSGGFGEYEVLPVCNGIPVVSGNPQDNPLIHFYPGGPNGPPEVTPTGVYSHLGGTPSGTEAGSSARGIWIEAPNPLPPCVATDAPGWRRMGATAVYQILTADFNNDGRVDIYTPSLSARLLINLGAYEGRVFKETYVGWNAGGFYGSASGTFGDLDKNGLLDDFIAVNHDGLKLLKNGSYPAEFPGAVSITLGHGRMFGSASLADMNNDGNLDVVLASENNEYTDVYRSLGRDCMVEIWASRHTGNPPYSLANMNWEQVPLVELTTIDKARVPIENGLPGYPQTAMAIADFDGDGDMDVMRSSRFAPLVLFQNVWNTQRHVRIEAKFTRGNISQTTTSFISVRGSTSTVVPLDRRVAGAVGGK